MHPSPDFLGNWLLVALLLFQALANAITLAVLLATRKSAQKRLVAFDQQFVAKSECDLRHDAIQKRLDEMSAQIFNNNLAAVEGRRALYAKIEDTRKELTSNIDTLRKEMNAEIGKVYDHIGVIRRELDAKIDGVPERVIATLRNTGAIGRP
jgi:biopolymer transport protein ExbB/TolQ